MTDRKYFLKLAEKVSRGLAMTQREMRNLAALPETEVFHLLPGADFLREHFYGRKIQLCTICNGKSGRCSENCAFCAQSRFADAEISVYPLLAKEKLQAGAFAAMKSPIVKYSIVTSGRRLSKSEVKRVAEAIAGLPGDKMQYCASLGILDEADMRLLRNSGVTRYHHNLETARSHFDNLCTTHGYEERIATIRAARKAGMSICCGGIFGVGESDAQVLELACTLKELEVDAVPVNFLSPIKGTRLAEYRQLTPLRCLKIIAIFRYLLPDKDILICGGREGNLGDLHPLVFMAGASGIMTGNYLTTQGRNVNDDCAMLEKLGLSPR